jgi:pyruvate dehydrogenase E1 component alpha subunit
MHLCDVTHGFLGTNAVVAAHIPIAGGVALSNQLRKNGRVTAVFFGDGSTCEGAFFETLNMAALWKLPLVMVCENNGYAISVPTEKAIPNADVAKRALGFSLPGVAVDGNDPLEVWAAVSTAVGRARAGEGPTLVECKTTRWERHSAISAGKYDNEEEAMKWKRVDPIPRFAALLRERGVAEERLVELKDRAFQANQEALSFAKASPAPAPDTVADFVFA